jgi:hypothetical protein
MRVRPFFWIFLTTICAGVLIFAATITLYKAVPMQAHIDQVTHIHANSTSIYLHLTDPDGLPIDEAKVIPRASMPDMSMGPQQAGVRSLGQGIYLAWMNFSMAGSWKIDITARADGFATIQQSLMIQIA